MWGFICSGEFTSDISYRNITSALFFTLRSPGSWRLAFLVPCRWPDGSAGSGPRFPATSGSARSAAAMDVGGRARGTPETRRGAGRPADPRVHLRAVHRAGAPDGRRHRHRRAAERGRRRGEAGDEAPQEASANLACGWTTTSHVARRRRRRAQGRARRAAAKPGRRHRRPRLHPRPLERDRSRRPRPTATPLWRCGRRAGRGTSGPRAVPGAATEFRFDHVTAKPLSRETWLTYATTYRDDGAGRHVDPGHGDARGVLSRGRAHRRQPSAMVFALALVLSLVLAAALASMVTAPLRRMARATQAHGARRPERARARAAGSASWARSRNRSTTWPTGSRRRSTSWSPKSRRASGASASWRRARPGCARARSACSSPSRRPGSASGTGTSSRIGWCGTTRCTGSMASARRSSPARWRRGRGASCPRIAHA